MADISTKELFDKFFEGKDPEIVKKTRAQIDRPEVYDYEAKIGKQLVDMNVDELFDMINSFNDNRKHDESKTNYSITYNSYAQITSGYRSLFNFYIDNYGPIYGFIRNPFNDKRMRGAAAAERLSQSKTAFTWKTVEDLIQKVHSAYEDDKAKYIECIMLLYYNGFAKAEEIMNLTEDMINFKTKEVRLTGRTITLSDRSFELLKFVHGLSYLKGWRFDYLMASWRGRYFKYAIRPKEELDFNNRTPQEIVSMINSRISVDVKKKFGIDVNYRMLYLLGFYEKVEKTFGKERARELVLSVRNSKDAEDLMSLAKEYGIVAENVSYLKSKLRPFI